MLYDIPREHLWYQTEYAKTARSTCKEFRCKQKIEKGELRMGVMQDMETDHFGENLGWYHPACLFKTFDYKKNACPRPDDIDEFRGYTTLMSEDQDRLRQLMAGKSDPAAAGAAAGATPTDGTHPNFAIIKNLTIRLDEEGVTPTLVVSGNTFPAKDVLRSLGGKWDGPSKSWMFIEESAQKKLVCDVMQLDASVIDAIGSAAVAIHKVVAKHATKKTRGASDDDAPPKAKARKETSGVAPNSTDDANSFNTVIFAPFAITETNTRKDDLQDLCVIVGCKKTGSKSDLYALLAGQTVTTVEKKKALFAWAKKCCLDCNLLGWDENGVSK